VRVDDSSSVLPTPQLSAINDTHNTSPRVGAVLNDGVAGYTWMDDAASLTAMQTTPDGSIVRAPRVVFPRPGDRFAGVDMAWSGSEYVVTWQEGAAKHGVALRLDPALRLLDPAPFELSAAPLANDPVVVATSTGVTFAYSRDENGVTRLFTRTLDRTGSTPRKHVAGR